MRGSKAPPPPKKKKKSQNIGFLSNTGRESLKNHKATKPATNVEPSSARQRNAIKMAVRWQADDSTLKVIFGSYFPSSTKKTVVEVEPPLKKLSGFALMHTSTNSKVNLGFLPNFNYQECGRMTDLSEKNTKPGIVANSITKYMND